MANDQLNDKGVENLAELLADDIAALQGNAHSASSMAVELKGPIRTALARGVTYRQVASAFAARGLRAEPDTIRIAVNRSVVTKAARARKNKQTSPGHRPVPPQTGQAAEAQMSSEAESHRRGPNLTPRLK